MCTQGSMSSQKGLWDPLATYSSHFVQKIQLPAAQFDFACSGCETKKDSGSPGLSRAGVCLAWTGGFVILLQRCQKEEQVLCLVLVLLSLIGVLQCRTNWESLQMWQRLMGLHCSDKMCGHSTTGHLRAAGHFFF